MTLLEAAKAVLSIWDHDDLDATERCERDSIGAYFEELRAALAAHAPADQSAELDRVTKQRLDLLKACKAVKRYWQACADSCRGAGEDMSHPSVHQAYDTEALAALCNEAYEQVLAAIANATPQEDKPAELEWIETDDGWEAASAQNDDGSPFIWRVEWHVDSWWASNSDDELLGAYANAPPLDFGHDENAAKAWCQTHENELRKAAEDE